MRGDDCNFENTATVLFLPMGYGASHPMVQIASAVVCAANPEKRIVVVSNPDRTPGGTDLSGNVMHQQVRNGDLSSIHGPLAEYLRATGVTEVNIAGCSWGAEQAAIFAAHAAEYDLRVLRLLAVEPPGVEKRRFWQLAKLFFSAKVGVLEVMGPLATLAPAYYKAWTRNNQARYLRILMNSGSIAVARIIAKGEFPKNLATVQAIKPPVQIIVAAGARSELTNPAWMKSLAAAKNLQKVDLGDHPHALSFDPYLLAALLSVMMQTKASDPEIATADQTLTETDMNAV